MALLSVSVITVSDVTAIPNIAFPAPFSDIVYSELFMFFLCCGTILDYKIVPDFCSYILHMHITCMCLFPAQSHIFSNKKCIQPTVHTTVEQWPSSLPLHHPGKICHLNVHSAAQDMGKGGYGYSRV